jgi:hypothetical protein
LRIKDWKISDDKIRSLIRKRKQRAYLGLLESKSSKDEARETLKDNEAADEVHKSISIDKSRPSEIQIQVSHEKTKDSNKISDSEIIRFYQNLLGLRSFSKPQFETTPAHEFIPVN